MKIEDIIIEDTSDANYFIRKFFNGDFTHINMKQLEQLVLTAYNYGNKKRISDNLEIHENEPKSPPKVSVAAPTFKINDRVKVLEEVEIGHSSEYISANTIGTVTLIKGDTITVLFEAGEDGEMIEINIPFDKIEKES
jgi:hypothetical protein